VGAFSLAAAEKMAHALSGMDIRRAFVVHGAEGWDEATPLGPYHIFDVTPGTVHHEIRDPATIGVPVCTAEDLAGGDAEVNAAALEDLLRGGKGPHRDAACLGAGLALEVSGVAADHAEGISRAEAAIDSGATGRLLDGLRTVEAT
jgi:anthranilate phosphoribosyltransferase